MGVGCPSGEDLGKEHYRAKGTPTTRAPRGDICWVGFRGRVSARWVDLTDSVRTWLLLSEREPQESFEQRRTSGV